MEYGHYKKHALRVIRLVNLVQGIEPTDVCIAASSVRGKCIFELAPSTSQFLIFFLAWPNNSHKGARTVKQRKKIITPPLRNFK